MMNVIKEEGIAHKMGKWVTGLGVIKKEQHK
jgi:hypothetical protein